MKNSRRFSKPTFLFLTFFCIFLFSKNSTAQSGLLLNTSDVTDGYVLFDYYPSGDAFLINNCGEVVHIWEGVTQLSLHPKLLPSGNLLFTKNNRITEMAWDGSVVKSHLIDIPGLNLAYEQIKLPNGNYLCVGRRGANQITFDTIGFNTAVAFPYLMDVVIEIDYETGAIVWEWNIFDHVIQERDPNKGNYGSIAAHPELLDMDALSLFDWTNDETFMINGMDYNPDLDQIVLSPRKLGEIIIIDHSTTTAEAAGHSGGNSGKGGDILYRWGNPQNYGRGIETDHFLHLQHNPIWITEGLYKGKLMCFNNGLNRHGPLQLPEYSDVPILTTPIDSFGNYILHPSEAFGPSEPDFLLSGNTISDPLYSGYMGGSQIFPNGNIFVTESMEGRLIEYDTAGQPVWIFQMPNFTTPFRTEKYPPDYPAFVGKDLTPNGFVPFTNNPVQCDSVSSLFDLDLDNPNISITDMGSRSFSLENELGNAMEFRMFSINGQLSLRGLSISNQHTITLSHLESGVYVFHVRDVRTKKVRVMKMFLR